MRKGGYELMKAQDIKAGMTYTIKAGNHIVGGWEATGDAVVQGRKVFVPVKHYAGQDGALEFKYDYEIPMDAVSPK